MTEEQIKSRAEAEENHLEAAENLGRAIEEQALEYSRLVATGKSTFEAQKLCDATFALKIEHCRAQLDVTRARLEVCSCR